MCEMYHLYDCEICGGVHEWEFNGECRDNSTRFLDIKDYARRRNVPEDHVALWEMSDRVASDEGAPEPWNETS